MIFYKNKIQRLALYLYFFSLNFQVFNLMGLGSAARLTGFMYLAAILPDYKSFFKTSYLRSFLIPLLIFWVYLTIISLININIASSSFFDSTLLLNILLFWVLVNHERKDPGILVKGMLSFALGAVFLTILYNEGIGIEYAGGRVSIFGDNANGIAVRLSVAAIVLIYLALNNTLSLKIWRFLLLLPLPPMILFMFETGSRKAFIGFAGAFIIGTLLYKTKRKRYKVLLLVLGSIAAVYLIQMLQQSEVLISRLLKTAEEGSLAGREDIWATIIPLIKENFLFGVGKTGYHKFAIQEFGSVTSPHNVILEVLAYIGIIGLFTYVYFIVKATWQAFFGYRIKGLLLPLLLLIPSWGLIFGGQALGGKLVWAIFALAVSTIFYTKNKPIYIYENPLRNR